jgi:hypothetical protein
MFKTCPGLVPIPQAPDLWYLVGPLVYVTRGLTITIPPLFISDDASIPKFLDCIDFLDRQGLSRRPGLLHDGIYALGREKGKAFADHILFEACMSEGMARWQARIYWLAVHLFGGPSWTSDDACVGGVINSGDFFTVESYKLWLRAGRNIYT